jgi:hypothetical protein
VRYRVWIKGRREETERVVNVPNEGGGGFSKDDRIRSHACGTMYFGWSDYDRLEYEPRVPNWDPLKGEWIL